jgi:AraC-like DNA-binding protein
VAIAIYFTDEFLSQLCDAPGYSMEILEMQNRSERGLRITGPCRRDLISLFNEVISSEGIAQLGRFLTMLDRILKVPEYQSLTSSAYKIRPPKREMDRFIEVYDYILKNFQGTITLTKAAAICGMSENAFCRFFKSRTQRTLTQFVNEIRISHACSLLREQNDPLKNIYRQCGYNNAVFFHRSFKRITGLTPKQYQENCHAV